MAFDSARGKTVLVAGDGGLTGPLLGDTWEWDETNWTQRSPAVSPPPARQQHVMAFEAGRGKTLLFGGQNGSSLGDTWEWDGLNWAQRSPAKSPSARIYSAMAYETARGKTLLFGGDSAAKGIIGDTWEWDGTNWTQASPATSPLARQQHALAYDTARSRAILYGGFGCPTAVCTTLGDTWEWDGTNWMQRTPATSPPARSDHALAYDKTRGKTVLFGGSEGAGMPIAETWEWDGTNWMQRSPASSPPARWKHAMAFDDARGRTVVFGGADVNALALGDTWEWDGSSWSQPFSTGLPSPPARSELAMAYDSAHGDVVLFGGTNGANLGDTWLYHTRGGPCALGTQCDTGFCVDGVCCEGTSMSPYGGSGTCGTCQACNTAASPGVCAPVAAFTSDPDSCAAPSVCGPTGSCGSPNGQPCTTGSTCASTFCASGVCCSSACNGRCDVCTAALGSIADGTCTVAPPRYAGAPSCAPYVCTSNETCLNACATDAECAAGNWCNGISCLPQRPNGQTCGNDDQCTSSVCAGGVCCAQACVGACAGCNGAGLCVAAAAGSAGTPACAPFVCDGASLTCPTSCASDNGCANGSYCQGGTCAPSLADGAVCNGNKQCQSGFCASGTCCNAACSGACQSCAGGTCALAPAGSPGCDPFVCDGKNTTCPTSCASDSGCMTGLHCINGACTSRLLDGATCTQPGDCVSGFCVDGFCCNTSCVGDCVSCALPGSAGACTPAVAGTDPRKLCGQLGMGACKATCGDQGLCVYPAAGAPCSATPATCLDATHLQQQACDGKGTCVALTTDCTPYLCTGNACPTSCVPSSNVCAGNNSCMNNTCGLHRQLGEACSAVGDCDSGFCADGVCCDVACKGPCLACNLQASPGHCNPAVGADPHHDCPGDGVCLGTCKLDQSCAFPADETKCDVCKACDGNGHCTQLPKSGDDGDCSTIPCYALSSDCRTYSDLTARRCVSVGLCSSPNDPVTCTHFVDQPDGTACTGGACLAGQCVAGSDAGGKNAGGSSGCAMAPPVDGWPGAWALACVLVLLLRRRRA
jgi:hypothetical protein